MLPRSICAVSYISTAFLVIAKQYSKVWIKTISLGSMTSSFLLSLYQVDLWKNWLTSQNKHIEWKIVQFVIPVLSGDAPPYTWFHFNDTWMSHTSMYPVHTLGFLSCLHVCEATRTQPFPGQHTMEVATRNLYFGQDTLHLGPLPGSKWDNAHPETIAFPPYTEESYDLFLQLQDQHQHKTIRNSPVSKPCNHTWGLLSLP